ncbi:MAG: hypothetical protein ACTIDY_01855 [Halomonadaceae bacterium]|uniref:Uncharacterized protein n=1 Tax=Halomonas colorata TaxID=2742615 RepID=A0ABR9FY53_9GAMM|nr:hypothetical protein [Halomonas colorata]MBE0463559.1 hypothetical protein [Halomonas colorata]
MMYRAYNVTIATGYVGYGYGWRFSDARSVQAATSDRACLGGNVKRCHALPEKPL